MSMLFGSAGELLTPLDDLMDGDIKLSLELGLELKDPLGGIGGYGSDDWCGWSSLRSSPTFDIFGDRELVMVSPESVMPLIKREIKQERLPTPEPAENIEHENDLEQLRSEIRAEQIKQEEDEEELVEEEEEDEEENDEEEEEEAGAEEEDDEDYEEEVLVSEVLPSFKPKEKHLWTPQVLTTRPTMVKTEPSVYQQRHLQQQQQTSSRVRSQEVVVPRTAQTLRVMHPAKTNPVNPRSLLVKKNKSFEGYPKPAYSYSCLIAMALKNSITGSLPVAEIYNFMCEHFPYFKSAPSGWKNSVRHNLSLNKCFEKIEKTSSGGGSCRKGCLWAMNPAKVAKMDDEVAKWSKKDPLAIRRSMRYPEELERMEKGNLKIGSRRVSLDSGADEDIEEVEDEEEIEEEEDDEEDSDDEREVPPSLKRFDSRLSSQSSSGTSSQTYDDLGLPDEMYNELNLLEEVMSEAKRPRLGVSSQAAPARHPSHHLYVRHHLASQV